VSVTEPGAQGAHASCGAVEKRSGAQASQRSGAAAGTGTCPERHRRQAAALVLEAALA
jgi:hypothetical protein